MILFLMNDSYFTFVQIYEFLKKWASFYIKNDNDNDINNDDNKKELWESSFKV